MDFISLLYQAAGIECPLKLYSSSETHLLCKDKLIYSTHVLLGAYMVYTIMIVLTITFESMTQVSIIFPVFFSLQSG